MLKPLDLASRLQVLLEQTQVTIVDMSDIYEKREALNNCRAPAMGWRDYVNGEPYDPPTFANDTQHYYGPRDGTAWHRDKNGEPVQVDPNPNSRQFGGVRPWSPDEIIEAMTDPHETPGYFPLGIRSLINKFKHMHQAAKPGIKFVADDYLSSALELLWRAIERDKGRVGTEFTKYLSLHMDLPGGAPAGFHGEHRTIRGILSKLSKMIPRIADQIETGEYDPGALTDAVGGLGSKKIRVKDVDKSIPYEKNPFGLYAPRLESLYTQIRQMVTNGDADGIRSLSDEIQDFYDQVDEDDQRFKGEGMAHGTLGSQPKDRPALGTPAHRINLLRFSIYVVDPDPKKMDLKQIRKAGREIAKDDVVLRRDPESDAPLVRHFMDIESPTEARAISSARDAYSKKYDLPKQFVYNLPFTAKAGEDSGAGFHNITGSSVMGGKGRLIKNPGLSGFQQHADIDPDFKAELADILHSLRYGSSKQRIGQARRALDIVEHLFSVIEHTVNPRPRPKLEARPDERGGGREAKAGGYNIIDVDKNQLVARAESAAEAASHLQRMNNPVMASLDHISAMLTKPKVGDIYYDDLFELSRQVVAATQSEDKESLDDALEEIRLTKSFIEDDIKADPKQHAPMLTERDYRIAIRKLGISDYPEKGTVNDPEIDEHGNLSRWAQAGYPMVQKDTSHGKGVLSGTLYAPGKEDQGEVMVDKHISQDLKLSAQSIGNIWKRIQERLAGLSDQLYEHHVWADDLDSIDLQLLRETCNRIAVIMVEEIRDASRAMTG